MQYKLVSSHSVMITNNDDLTLWTLEIIRSTLLIEKSIARSLNGHGHNVTMLCNRSEVNASGG